MAESSFFFKTLYYKMCIETPEFISEAYIVNTLSGISNMMYFMN